MAAACLRSKSSDEVAIAQKTIRNYPTSIKLLEFFEPLGPYVDETKKKVKRDVSPDTISLCVLRFNTSQFDWLVVDWSVKNTTLDVIAYGMSLDFSISLKGFTTGKQMDTTWDCTWFPEDHNACYNCIVGNDKERLLILCIYLLMQIQSWKMIYYKVYLIKIRRLLNPYYKKGQIIFIKLFRKQKRKSREMYHPTQSLCVCYVLIPHNLIGLSWIGRLKIRLLT
jgi:hypothetical protein